MFAKKKKCGHSNCHCCRIKCTRSPDKCREWCVKKKYKECVIVSIPPEYRNKCWNYFTHSFIDKCLGECVYFKSVTAWKKETVEQEDKREEEQTTEEN